MDTEAYIHIPPNKLIEPEEYHVAKALAKNHEHVHFIPESHIHMPDIEYLGRCWEIKSPRGGSSRTIENNVRLALKQSENIIINLEHIKINNVRALAEIKRQCKLTKKIKSLMVIAKSGEILYIK